MMQDVSEAAQISVKFNQEKGNYVMTVIMNLEIEWKCVSVSDYTAWRLSLMLNIHFCEYIFSYMFSFPVIRPVTF